MINTRLWRPDTCECRVHIKYDKDFPDTSSEYLTEEGYLQTIKDWNLAGRKNTVSLEEATKIAKFANTCPIHAEYRDTPQHLEKLFVENRYKNYNLNAIVQDLNNKGEDVDPLEIKFSFDGDRKVSFTRNGQPVPVPIELIAEIKN
jgi:hypothetical protein